MADLNKIIDELSTLTVVEAELQTTRGKIGVQQHSCSNAPAWQWQVSQAGEEK